MSLLQIQLPEMRSLALSLGRGEPGGTGDDVAVAVCAFIRAAPVPVDLAEPRNSADAGTRVAYALPLGVGLEARSLASERSVSFDAVVRRAVRDWAARDDRSAARFAPLRELIREARSARVHTHLRALEQRSPQLMTVTSLALAIHDLDALRAAAARADAGGDPAAGAVSVSAPARRVIAQALGVALREARRRGLAIPALASVAT